ncbi:MAG TPA: NlpC/P60 family protein [Candidatus Sulfotelmatobacter sp.]|nr:NlpC/P60 family protein [Candidatus Sulfotelmatobacter sp.]
MEFPAKTAGLVLLACAAALPAASGQAGRGTDEGVGRELRQDSALQRRVGRVRTVTRAEGREIVRVAMDSRHVARSRYDCSHFVHGTYERAGFHYTYASSTELYEGDADFRRVSHPQPGDLAVWPGHAGIVLDPARHSFLSVLRKGPGVDRYDSKYWRGRGRPRFFRYVEASSREVLSSSVRNASGR